MTNKLSKENFIEKSKELYNEKFDYSKTNYINTRTKVIIICPLHGEFEILPRKFLLSKCGCPNCARYKTQEYFIKEAQKVHNNFYSYEKTIYIGDSYPIIITCPKHGDFEQTANNHIHNHGCPKCKRSRGEEQIEQWLKEKNIPFIPQMTFNDCRGIRRTLPFDFYLPEINTCIEYDGRQHFEPVKFSQKTSLETSKKAFLKIQKSDKIKNKYCLEHNINLIRIPYFLLNSFLLQSSLDSI